MDRGIGRWLLVVASLCVVVVVAYPSIAFAAFDFSASGGATLATPAGRGVGPMYGWAVAVGGGWSPNDRHTVGARIRFQHYPSDRNQMAGSLVGFYRIRTNLSEVADPFFGVSGGAGLWMGCVHGDYCGGIGANLGAEVGALFPIAESASLVIGFEFLAQLGMVNLVKAMLMPHVWAGIEF